jgi:hypothetical protein
MRVTGLKRDRVGDAEDSDGDGKVNPDATTSRGKS